MLTLVLALAPVPTLRCAPTLRCRTLQACDVSPADECDAIDKYCRTTMGMRFIDVVVGEGKAIKDGDCVSVHYTGSLLSDSSRILTTTRSGDPLTFRQGSGNAPMWEEACAGMKVGGQRRVLVPPSNTIPNWQSLNEETGRFDCELVGIDIPGAAVAGEEPISRRQIFQAILSASFIPYFLPEEIKPEMWREASVLRLLGLDTGMDSAIKTEIENDLPLSASQRREVLREERSLASDDVERELYRRR